LTYRVATAPSARSTFVVLSHIELLRRQAAPIMHLCCSNAVRPRSFSTPGPV
jgi:5,10-methylenetetrahydrofolate reductase